MLETFRAYTARVRPILEDALQGELGTIVGGTEAADLASMLADLQAGKKIRGCLTCLVTEALGAPLAAAISRAVAIELIQAATLIHDDFVDQDTVRRNRPALWTQEGARRAVLIGDVIFASAISMMNELGREDGLVVSRAIVQIAKGALHEPLDPPALVVKLESGGLPAELYEHIIRLKTGILFGSACKLGAIAAEADEKVGEACYRFGLRLGEAYQIADDVKDMKEITSAGGMSARQLVTLAPSLLHFMPERRADIAARLREGCIDGDDNLLLDVAEAMEYEIGQRLDRAAREIEGTFPETAYSPLMRRAASDVVGMFKDA